MKNESYEEKLGLNLSMLGIDKKIIDAEFIDSEKPISEEKTISPEVVNYEKASIGLMSSVNGLLTSFNIDPLDDSEKNDIGGDIDGLMKRYNVPLGAADAGSHEILNFLPLILKVAGVALKRYTTNEDKKKKEKKRKKEDDNIID